MALSATYTVELATAAGANPATWSDISAYVKRIEFRRGRDDWLTQVQPGTARLLLKNDDGRFSPALTSSPLYPHVDNMRAVRIKAVLSAVTYHLFLGYIQSINPDPRRNVRECSVTLTDGSVWLALAKSTPTYSSVASGTSIGVALDSASWPAALRALDAGQSTFTPSFTDQTVLSQVQRIGADNEAGLVYFDGQGRVVFEDRHHRLKSDHLTSQATFNATMEGLVPERPSRDIANEVKVAYSGGGTVTRSNSASQTSYGPRRLDITASFLAAAEATDRADWTLSQRKDPHERPIHTLVAESDSVLTQILARELSDRITVQETVNTGIDGPYFLESREVALAPHGVALAVWQLSPVDANSYWILGTSTLGQNPMNTRLAY